MSDEHLLYRFRTMDSEVATARIEKRIEFCKNQKEVLDSILPYLKQWEGKVVNKRLKTFLEEALKDREITFRLDNRGYAFYMEVYKKGTQVFQLSLMNPYSKLFQIFYFEEHNQYFLNIDKKIERLEELLLNIEDISRDWNKSLALLKHVERRFENKIGLEEVMD